MFPSRVDRPALLSVLSAVPAMSVVKDLMSTRCALELHDKDRLHARALAGGIPCIHGLDDYTFRKKVELAHADDVGVKSAYKLTA
jgi:hypothetical protein